MRVQRSKCALWHRSVCYELSVQLDINVYLLPVAFLRLHDLMGTRQVSYASSQKLPLSSSEKKKNNARPNLFPSIPPVLYLSFSFFLIQKLLSFTEPINRHNMRLRLERMQSAALTALVMRIYVKAGKAILFSYKCAVP